MRAEVGSLVSETEKLIFPLLLTEQKNSVMRILGQALPNLGKGVKQRTTKGKLE